VRFFAVAWLGRIYGAQMIAFFSRHYKPTMYALIALAILTGIGALVYYKWYRPRQNAKNAKLPPKPAEATQPPR
jgi:membrane protein implicated in regulation of membrane protease activity